MRVSWRGLVAGASPVGRPALVSLFLSSVAVAACGDLTPPGSDGPLAQAQADVSKTTTAVTTIASSTATGIVGGGTSVVSTSAGAGGAGGATGTTSSIASGAGGGNAGSTGVTTVSTVGVGAGGGFPGDGGGSSGPAFPVGFWQFDDCVASSAVLLDSSGFGNTANRTASTACVPGIEGLAVDFDANKDSVTVSDGTSFEFTDHVAVAAWIKPTSFPCEFPGLLVKGSTTQHDATFGGYVFTLNANGDNDFQFLSGALQIVTHNANGRWINHHMGEWIHVAFTLNANTRTAKFYINGKPTDDEFIFGTWEGLNLDVPSKLFVGSGDPANGPNPIFEGQMQDMFLFNRALTADEIQTIYNADQPADASFPP